MKLTFKRRYFWVATLLFGATLMITFLMWFDATPISKANYSRIQDGMPEWEVRQILGKPGFVINTDSNHVLKWSDSHAKIEIRLRDDRTAWAELSTFEERSIPERLQCLFDLFLRKTGITAK